MRKPRGSVKAGPKIQGARLDLFVARTTGLSRNRAQGLISKGMVRVNGKPAKKNHIISAGEEIGWEIPPPEPEETLPQEISLEVLYEDEHIAVIDKPAGMVMYPGPGHSEKTLLNALLWRYPGIVGVGGRGRPGIFHRLDKDTSGLVAVALTEDSYGRMVDEMKENLVDREYASLLFGELPIDKGVIDAPMGRSDKHRKRMSVKRKGGRPAVTRFEVTERFPKGYTLVSVKLETGRTHQIRVHFSHIGHPVAGDPVYSRGQAKRELGLERQFLHARQLSFDHPSTGRRVTFESVLPDDLERALRILRSP